MIVKLIIVSLICYFIGCINPSYVYCRLFKRIDIRDLGSGNAGSTNTLRMFGPKAGIIVFIADVLKGVVAMLIATLLADSSELVMIFGAVSTVIGHNWPIILGGRGGKGIATSTGIFFYMNWSVTLVVLIIVFIIIFSTKYVSIGSLSGLVCSPFCFYFTGGEPYQVIIASIFGAMAVYQHRSNIKNLCTGNEKKVNFRKGERQ